MTVTSLLSDTVTITNRSQDTDEDEYGDPQLVAGSSFVTSARVEFGNFGATQNYESLNREDRTEVIARIFLPASTTIGHLDKVVHAGLAYEVRGEPEPQYDLTGVHHIQAHLSRIEGG